MKPKATFVKQAQPKPVVESKFASKLSALLEAEKKDWAAGAMLPFKEKEVATSGGVGGGKDFAPTGQIMNFDLKADAKKEPTTVPDGVKAKKKKKPGIKPPKPHGYLVTWKTGRGSGLNDLTHEKQVAEKAAKVSKYFPFTKNAEGQVVDPVCPECQGKQRVEAWTYDAKQKDKPLPKKDDEGNELPIDTVICRTCNGVGHTSELVEKYARVLRAQGKQATIVPAQGDINANKALLPGQTIDGSVPKKSDKPAERPTKFGNKVIGKQARGEIKAASEFDSDLDSDIMQYVDPEYKSPVKKLDDEEKLENPEVKAEEPVKKPVPEAEPGDPKDAAELRKMLELDQEKPGEDDPYAIARTMDT